MELLPRRRSVPLLWFGLFRSRRELDSDDLESLIADCARARLCRAVSWASYRVSLLAQICPRA